MIPMAVELAAHWRTYHRALKAHEPCAFSWVAFGYRIVDAAIWLREWLGYHEQEHCVTLIALSGAMYYGGRRGDGRRRIHRSCKRRFVPARSIPEPWDINPFTVQPKRKKTKWFKKPRAVVEGTQVLLWHKGRKVAWKTCMTEEAAILATARFNEKPLPVSKLEVTDGEEQIRGTKDGDRRHQVRQQGGEPPLSGAEGYAGAGRD